MIDTTRLFPEIIKEFSHLAKTYQEENRRPPVLVIDNVNRLAVENPSLLRNLQDIAKDAADDRVFVTVFVTSEGHAPRQMMGKLSTLLYTISSLSQLILIIYMVNILGRSSRSRLGKILTIGDINPAEVRDLLVKSGAEYEKYSEVVYGLVGGRIKYINQVVRELRAGSSWKGMVMILV